MDIRSRRTSQPAFLGHRDLCAMLYLQGRKICFRRVPNNVRLTASSWADLIVFWPLKASRPLYAGDLFTVASKHQ